VGLRERSHGVLNLVIFQSRGKQRALEHLMKKTISDHEGNQGPSGKQWALEHLMKRQSVIIRGNQKPSPRERLAVGKGPHSSSTE
jgi:hypothetical protein